MRPVLPGKPGFLIQGSLMRNFNENTITNAVLERISGASDPRIRQVSEALVRHLHAFVREVRPTQKE
jgi:hydroxyquinol 1,2-dioxygenase